MVRTRAYRSRWLWVPAAIASAVAQGAIYFAYDASRPDPTHWLTIRLGEAGTSWDYVMTPGVAQQPRITVHAAGRIEVTTDAGTQLADDGHAINFPDRDTSALVTVTMDDGAKWQKRFDIKRGKSADVAVSYTPSRGSVLVTRDGDLAPLMRCKDARCSVEVAPGTHLKISTVLAEKTTFGGYHQHPMRTPAPLVPLLGDPLADCIVDDAVTSALRGNVLDCAVTIKADTDIAVDLAAEPERIDVAFADPDEVDKLIKPIVPPPPPAPIEAEKLEEQKPPEVAVAQIKPPPQIKPPEPPPPPEQQKPQQPPPQPPNMTMVEVQDKHTVDKAPDDAKFLSDKNRDVAEETRATKTNLDKESEGTAEMSRESDDKTSAEIGGPEDKIRQLEETQATTDDHIRETDHSGDSEVAKGVIEGQQGDNGEEGTGLLSMRGIEKRGSIVDQKDGKKAGKKGLPGVNTSLAFQDYERLMGKDRMDEEREVAARKMSSKKGRWEKKLAAIKSSLENFVPDVRPGNQTALKTRAHPYALYIARMHRRIHELWGFGFLEALDDKGSDYPLNNPDLWVNLEVSVNPDGTLHKVTIAKTSGKTEFDVAAVDTVISSGPFDATPEAIRSVDGRIYLRWGFYRNWRQCGTFNVEPYILTSVPEDNGVGVLDDGAMVKSAARIPGKKKHHPIGDQIVTPDDGLAKQKVSPDSSVTDKQALFAANQWVSAFATASIDKLVKWSTVPFYAGGQVAASTAGDLKEMFSGLVVESGQMKDWKLLTAGEYTSGSAGLPEGNVVLQVRTTKETFAVVLTRTKSGDYRATQIAR